MPRSRRPGRLLRSLVPGVLAVVVVAGILPAPAAAIPATAAPAAPATKEAAPAAVQRPAVGPRASGPADPAASEAGRGQRPSSMYEGWFEHKDDAIAFTPGGRVTVGFTPRAGDRWTVGGKAPAALPAGRESGKSMARQRNAAGIAPGWRAAPGKVAADNTATDDAGKTRERSPVDAPSNAVTFDARPVSLVPEAPEPELDLAAAGMRRQVFGFLPYWEVRGASTRLDYGVLSTIAYFSVGVTDKGSLKKRDGDGRLTTGWGGWTSSSMTRVINAAHAKGTRVVLTVSAFAWTTSQARVQKALLGSRGARATLARQIVAAVRDRGADGVNLDFEPLARGYADEFVSLLRTIRSQFNSVRSGYQITYDTTAYIGNYPLEASVGRRAADAIFIMGYDYRTGSSSSAGSISPLSGPGYDLADTVRAYRARVPASRLILGIPWYGRAWSTATDRPRSRTLSGAKYGYSRPVNYETVVDYVRKYGRRWDRVEQSPYVVYRRRNCTKAYGCVTSWRQVWYEDAASMKRRYALVNQYNLRGAGMWALGYDGGRTELSKALSDSFLVQHAAPIAAIRVLAASQNDEGFIVRWVGKGNSAIASYDVQVSTNGGAWRTWLANTKASSNVFQGRTGVGYAFRVRARDRRGSVGSFGTAASWSARPSIRVGGFGRVLRDGLGYRSRPDTSARRLGTIKAGTIVAFTRGPIRADGYTWYEVTQPVRQWPPLSRVKRGVWIAVRKGSRPYVAASGAPNSTTVRAGIRGLDFGAAGTASGLGPGAPQTAVRAFSPNRDGSEDGLRLRWTNSVRMTSLVVRVRRLDGSLIGTRRIGARAAGAQSWTWNGIVDGRRLRDGRYLLQLVGTVGRRRFAAPSARPATKAQIDRYAVRIDTAPPKIATASGTNQVISPNRDGVRDWTRLTLGAAGGAVRWTIRVTAATGAPVRSVAGGGSAVTYTWRGTNAQGRRVPDGRYGIRVSLFDAAGNPVTRTATVTVDTRAPAVVAAASPRGFSPNGDGQLDTTVLSWTSAERASGSIKLWKGSKLIRTWKTSNVAIWKATWDGRRADGSRVGDGTYTLKVDVRDAGGNRRRTSTKLVLDRTTKGLAWAGDFTPQDGDALKPTSRLGWRLARDAKTTLRIFDATGRIVRTAWTGRSQADGARGWTWNGRRDDGSVVPQGRYLATLRVRSTFGVLVYSRWVWASAFTLTPNRTVVKAGQTLVIRFRSVEPLSARPRVTFRQPGREAVTIVARKLADGSWKASFRVRSGRRGTATIRVVATDRAGGRNATRTTVRVK
ncbi:MAG TPA: FlgD immunoglobulin-like domain containing protein [Candidatus Limnocylindrales bacterium]|nr:FlgD immunoglobulin-like domain containing protein [Candidatus Limnocylindrales bacterium]